MPSLNYYMRERRFKGKFRIGKKGKVSSGRKIPPQTRKRDTEGVSL